MADRLMDVFRGVCKSRGFGTIGLTVAADNARAVAFYRKTGWQVVSESETSLWMQLPCAEWQKYRRRAGRR